jgi:hypothetical protein
MGLLAGMGFMIKKCSSRRQEALIDFALTFMVMSLMAMAPAALLAAEQPAVQVSGVFGVATAQHGTNAEVQIRTDMGLDAGTVIRTAPGSAVDLYLGKDAGVIRLTQSTMVTILQLNEAASHSETYLHLQHGTLLGNGARISAGSRYQIKTATGIAAIANAAFRLHAEGYLVVVEGKAQFANVPPEGEPKVYVLSAPPAVYFSPTEGIKEAPKALVREVINQSKARLGK